MWAQAAQRRGFAARALPDSWIESHLLQLAAALIPSSMRAFLPPARSNGDLLLRDFHKAMAERLAEVLRRRECFHSALLPSRRLQRAGV